MTCSRGIRIRSRDCIEPPPTSGGQNCSGVTVDREACSLEECDKTNCTCAFFSISYYNVTRMSEYFTTNRSRRQVVNGEISENITLI